MKMLSAVVFTSVSFLYGCSGEETVLEPGRTQVVIADDACPVVKFAAQEMTNFLSRALGAPVPIVEKLESRVGVGERTSSVFLGEGEWTKKAGLDVMTLKEDGYFIKSVPDGVIIAGVDDACANPFENLKAGRGPSSRRATLHGVYGFLERYAGCRFYFPGELGEIVPKKDRIAFSADLRDEPDFDYRDSSGPYGGTQWFAPWLKNYRPPRLLNWYRLRVSGRERPMVHGVRHMQLRRRFAKTHPEYFVPGDEDAELCWSSDVRHELAKDAIAYLKGEDAASRGYVRGEDGAYDAKGWPTGAFFPGIVGVDAEDGYSPCPCAKCQAAYGDKKRPNYASELMWTAWRDIAAEVGAAGVKGRLAANAYSCYSAIPSVELGDNHLVGLARVGAWRMGSECSRTNELADVRAWAEKSHGKVHLHNWALKFGRTDIKAAPCISPKAVARYYRDVAPYACSVLMETSSERFSHTYLNDYMMAHTTWDASFDAEAALDEHHRLMFGPAAPEMKAFYEAMEDCWINEVTAGEVIMTPLGPLTMTPSYFEIWRRVYSPEKIAAWRALFEAAEKILSSTSTSNFDSSLCLQRVRLMREELFEPMAEVSAKFVDETDVAVEERRRRERKAVNLLPDGLTFHFVAKTPADMDKCPWKEIPFTYKPNTRYRLSCYIRIKDVKPQWQHDSSGATVGMWDPSTNWHILPNNTALVGSTGGWVHISRIWKTSPNVKSEGVSVVLRRALGEMEVKGLLLEELPEEGK